MASPLISVLMPCHNAARYVRSAIEAVLDQTLPTIELIVVDDGSTDDSADVLATIKDRRLRVITQPNAGAATARNRAFDVSHGDLILFLDADDWIPPGHLAALLSAVDGAKFCVGMGEWDRFHQDIDEARFPRRAGYRDASGTQWLADDWRGGEGMTNPGMFLVPRALIERHGGWDERLSLLDDFEFYARILSRSDGVRFASGARLHYRSGIEGSLSGSRNRKSAESACRSLLLGTQHLLDIEDTALTRRASANVLQAFEHGFYPRFADLRAKVRAQVLALGGSDLEPSGPAGFHKLRRWIGWRAARRIQFLAERWRLNGASRAQIRRPFFGR